MPVVLDALLVQLGTNLFFNNLCLVNEILLCVHWCPLEWGKWLRYKERSADHDLYFSVALFLGNSIVVFLCNALSQMSDSFHVFFRFRRETKHEIKLHTIPAAYEGFFCTVENNLFCKAFVDYITKPLGTGFRSKCKTALLNILHLAHYIQGKGIDTKGWQGNVYACGFKLVNQEVYQLFQMGVIAGA